MNDKATQHNGNKILQILNAQKSKKIRTVRESEPNFGLDGAIGFNSMISKDTGEVIKPKKIRQARASQMQIPRGENYFTIIEPKSQNIQPSRDKKFHSPKHAVQQKFLKKCISTSSIKNQLMFSNQLQVRKCPQINQIPKSRPAVDSKFSLSKIQQILARHKRNQTRKNESRNFLEKKIQKTEAQNEKYQNIQQIQFFNYKRTKQTVQDQEANKDLKQTISTVSSSRQNVKPLKIKDFQLGRQLGKGKFGCVKIARHKKTGMVFSLKIVKKSVVRQENMAQQFIKQVVIQSFLNHTNIIKLYSVFDDRQNIYLLLQLCPDGNLYKYMQKSIKVSQKETSSIMKSICEAVYELHFHNITHRDIKPQNIVMCYGMAKICDFGWSTSIKSKMRETFCGTPLYISPQLLSGNLYNQKVDLWALGILGYQMMTGSIPFVIKTQRDLSRIIDTQVVYPRWMKPESIDFLRHLLNKNPQGRESLQKLLLHPFLSKKFQN